MSYQPLPPQAPGPQPAPYAPPPPRKSRTGCVVALVVLGCLVLFGLGLIFLATLATPSGQTQSLSGMIEGKVAIVRVSGIIMSGSGESPGLLIGGIGSEGIVKYLRKARKDSTVKAVVLRINSPGGSPSACQEIYQEVQRLRESGKPIVASMADVAASGGYYVAAPCNEILATKSTMTGSIGVIFPTLEYHQGLAKLGVKMSTIKSGPYKDIGTPDRPMTPEE